MDQNDTQTILKQGDLVRYHIENNDLTDLGFVIGRYYEVLWSADSKLVIQSETNHIAHLVYEGELTDHADHFTLHRCPVTLPLGQLQKRLGVS